MPDAPLTLKTIVDGGRMLRPEPTSEQMKNARLMIAEFANQVVANSISVDKDLVAAIEDRIKAIDDMISDQLDAIYRHDDMRKMEASWRGLSYLVMNTETSTRLKLRLLNITRKELQNDLEKATDYDQSFLFKKVYEEEYGTFGGEPYSCLVGDLEFGRNSQDVKLLEAIAGVAAAAHAPFIAAAAPSLFDRDNWGELGVPRDLAKGFETADMVSYAAFREKEDSRYVTLVLPKFLLRLPYGKETQPVEGLGYEERVVGKEDSHYLWGNAAYLLTERITKAFALHGWTAAIRGVEGGGLVTGLPAHTYLTDDGDKVLKCPTQVAITDRREKELSDLGFVALVHRKGRNEAAFFGGATANKPKTYNLPEANANARLSSMLPYMLAASRFAHYMKSIMRDKVGSFMTRENVQTYLNRWIAEYILLDDNAPQAVKAKYPLREARVDVVDVPGKPGVYKAVAFLRPHFQLEELTVSIRLVAELPPPAA